MVEKNQEPNESGLISELMTNLDKFTDRIAELEGNLKNKQMQVLNLSEASSATIVNLSFELENVRRKIGELQNQLEEAYTKLSLREKDNFQLQKLLGSVTDKLKALKDQEKEKNLEIEVLNKKLESLNSTILKREQDEKRLDIVINEKEKLIETQNRQIELMNEKIQNLSREISEKQSVIENQTQEIKVLEQKTQELKNLVSEKDKLISEKEKSEEQLSAKLSDFVEKEKLLAQDLNNDERFILFKLQQHNNKLDYKSLMVYCEEKFEGLRLILKKLKEKGIVDYDGAIPMFTSEIKLIRKLI